jgi:uncharacterized protein YciI
MAKREFAVILQPSRENFIVTMTPEEEEAVEGHFVYFEKEHEQGRLKFAGRCEDGFLGLAVFAAQDRSEVEEIMRRDPVVRGNVMYCLVKEWRTALAPEGW